MSPRSNRPKHIHIRQGTENVTPNHSPSYTVSAKLQAGYDKHICHFLWDEMTCRWCELSLLSSIAASLSRWSEYVPCLTEQLSLQAGGCAGMCVDLTLFPLDTVKTRLQSPQGFYKAGGFRGIYAGVPSAAVGSFPNGVMAGYMTPRGRCSLLFVIDVLTKHHKLPVLCRDLSLQSVVHNIHKGSVCSASRASFTHFYEYYTMTRMTGIRILRLTFLRL